MTTITIDATKGGRVFDGVGAISGGGGNSVQLVSYPEPQRSDILDYLFRPGKGAELQILKVEIGGDAFSSCGAEPSHEHSRGAMNPNGGYEWWLMREAKARNPDITFYGLAWAAPGWIGGGHFWCQDMIDYLVDWVGCAASHSLTIDYLGGWNEQGYDCAWFKSLRKSLDMAGHTGTKIVSSDKDPYNWAIDRTYRPEVPWAIADEMKSDSELAAAIGVLGAHDVCSYPTTGIQCWSTATAVACGKPLWHSEVGAMPGVDGSPMIRSVIRGYIDAKMTGHIHWPLITTQPPGLHYLDRGLIWAAQPRSGHYIPKAMLGAIAAVTQFTKPGWVHIDSACGYLGGNRANGAYMALRAPDAKAWSLIVETTTATGQQNVTVTIKGGLLLGRVDQGRVSGGDDAALPGAAGRQLRVRSRSRRLRHLCRRPDDLAAAHLLAPEALARHALPIRGHRRQQHGHRLQGQRQRLLHRKRPIRRGHRPVQQPGQGNLQLQGLHPRLWILGRLVAHKEQH